jgi:GNAT superfamily N-acetyltransferase
MSVTLRFATPDDAAVVRETALLAFAEFKGVIDPPPGILFETEEDVRRALETEGGVVAIDGEAVVGSARFEERPGYLYIGRLAVPPAFRGRGIGAALMAFIEEHARSRGMAECHVSVRESLPGNVAMFEHWGYVPASRDPHPRVPTAYSIGMVKRFA